MLRLMRTIVMLPALAIVALLLGCATTKVPEATAPLAVHGALGVVELGPVHVTVADIYPGTKVKHGGAVSLVRATDPADVATNAETQILIESLKRPDLRIIMTIAEGRYRIVARRSAGISQLADLKGKRIATRTLTSAGYFLHRMLARAGLGFDQVEVKDMYPYSSMVGAIRDREVDAIAIWEPHAENAMRVLGGDGIELSGAGVYRELFNLNTTAAKLADPAKRAEILRFMRALVAATRAMNQDPAAAQQLVASAGGYQVDEVASSWRHHDFVASFPEDMLDVLVEEEIWLAKVQGRPPRSRDALATLIDRSLFIEATSTP